MMEIRYLQGGEKAHSRRLYEECFPEDSREFVDYYYAEKCRDNRILAVFDETDEIVSMIHTNPFVASLCGQSIPVQYVVAVATTGVRRRQGLMRRLLEQTLRDCFARGEAFSFLMPADPAYYEPMGYRWWRSQRQWTIKSETADLLTDFISDRFDFLHRRLPDTRFSFLSDHPERAGEAAAFVNRILSGQFDLYVERDAAYYERLIKEQASECGDVILIRDPQSRDGRICGTVCFDREEKLEYREPVFESGICEKRQPVMMGRIVSLEQFVKNLRFPEPFTEVLSVTDGILPENNGVFRIEIDKDGGRISRVPESFAERMTDIANLGQVLFGNIRIFINELV